jgi:hypothetical protein
VLDYWKAEGFIIGYEKKMAGKSVVGITIITQKKEAGGRK